MDEDKAKAVLRRLFTEQGLAVLATQASNGPYTTLVGFVASEDLQHIFFVTSRSTRKYAWLKSNPRVSMLIDSRANQASDFRDAVAVTALGAVQEIDKEKNPDSVALYLGKHPHLEDFLLSPTCALIRLRVEKYILVTRFQQVTTICLES
jgi:general stress protein 26